jgi:predicted regulator of Ras-like GTPase activity (Roadblock/LC7/MglB family)
MIHFDDIMKKLRSVNGYLGSAVLNYSGETLYIDEENTGTDIGYASAIFNDSFRSINEASLDIGFSDISSLETKTEDGHVFLMKSAGTESEETFSKIDIFCILRDDGNIALAKMVMDKSARTISHELANI